VFFFFFQKIEFLFLFVVKVKILHNHNNNSLRVGVSQDAFRLVSVVSNSSVLSGANFASVGGVEVIGFCCVPVTINRDKTRSRGSRNKSKNRFEGVSVVTSGARLSCTNFASVGGVEVIGFSSVVVTVDCGESRSRSCAYVKSVTFRLVSVVSNSSVLSCANFASVGGVEVITSGSVEISVNRDNRKRSVS